MKLSAWSIREAIEELSIHVWRGRSEKISDSISGIFTTGIDAEWKKWRRSLSLIIPNLGDEKSFVTD